MGGIGTYFPVVWVADEAGSCRFTVAHDYKMDAPMLNVFHWLPKQSYKWVFMMRCCCQSDLVFTAYCLELVDEGYIAGQPHVMNLCSEVVRKVRLLQ